MTDPSLSDIRRTAARRRRAPAARARRTSTRHSCRACSARSTTHEVDFADLYFQYTRSEGWSLEEGIVKAGSFSIDQGVGVRAVSGEKTGFAYSDDISLARADGRGARGARDRAARASRAVAPLGRRGAARALYRAARSDRRPRQRGQGRRCSSGSSACARALDPRVTQVMASLAGEYDAVLVARSDGVLAADVRPLVRLSCTVIVEQNGRREQGYAGGGGRFDYAYFADEHARDVRARGGAPGAGQPRRARRAGRRR